MNPPAPQRLERELLISTTLAEQAGALLLEHLRRGLMVEHKTGQDDPVTAADRDASRLITTGLQQAFPDDAVLSEEEADDPIRLSRERVWIIDPIDGTREYTQGSPDYCVSIGLAIRGEPVLGVVYAPAKGELFSGVVGHGMWKDGKPGGFSNRQDYRLSVSDTEYRRELHRYDLPGMVPSGSIALKLARVAAGEVDVTFTMSPRSEWDIAAGHALVRATGGVLRRRDGQLISYNARQPHITQGIIGGRPDAMNWLEGQLARNAVPTTHLNLTPVDAAWTALTPDDQRTLQDHPGVCIRHSQGTLRALIVVNPTTGEVQRSEGDAFQLERLARDVRRATGYGGANPNS